MLRVDSNGMRCGHGLLACLLVPLAVLLVCGFVPLDTRLGHFAETTARPASNVDRRTPREPNQPLPDRTDGCEFGGCEIVETDGANESRLRVCLSLKNGKLFANPDQASFVPSHSFQIQKSSMSLEQNKRLLVADLNRALNAMSYFDIYALPLPDEPVAPKKPDEPPGDADEQIKADYQEERTKYDADYEQYQGKQKLYDQLMAEVNAKALTREIRSFNGSWQEFINNTDAQRPQPFAAWKQAALASEPLRKAFAALGIDLASNDVEILDAVLVLDRVFGPGPVLKILAGQALTLKDSALDPFSHETTSSVDLSKGSICFRVADPLSGYVALPDDEKPLVTRALQRWRLEGKPWRPDLIREAIEEYYADRGLAVSISVNDFINLHTVGGNRPNQELKVLRWRVDRIFVPRIDKGILNKILRNVLSSAAFHEFTQRPEKYLMHYSDETTKQDFIDCLNEGEDADMDGGFSRLTVENSYLEVYLNRIRRMQVALDALGYVLDVTGQREDFNEMTAEVDLVVTKKYDDSSSSQPDDAGNQAPATGTTSPPINNNGDASSTPTPSPSPSPTPKDLPTRNLIEFCKGNNFLGGGFDFRPAQGIRGFGLYECRRVGNGALSIRVGADNKALGDVKYSTTFSFLNLPNAVSLDFVGGSEYESSRILNGLKTNERRTGGYLHLEVPLLRASKNTQIVASIEGKRQTVALSRDDNIISKQNLTTIDLGLRFGRDRLFTAVPTILTLNPSFKFGLGLNNEPRFTVFTMTGGLHSEFTRLIELDIDGRTGLASKGTPIFDQPSFGGEDVVRGFRRDDAIGLVLWSVQPELRFRLRGFSTPTTASVTESASRLQGLKRLLQENLALATFFDVGGIYRTTDSQPGFRRGPGIGLRFDYRRNNIKLATFKLDWAYGNGEGINGRGRGRFYFTVTTRDLPF